MKNFKEWFYSEEGQAVGTQQPTTIPKPTIQSATPTADKQQLTKAVQGTLQDPRVPKLAASMKGNNQNQLQKQVVPIAQNYLNQNPNFGINSPITAMDISRQMLPQLSMPSMQNSMGNQ